jgi:hypothetical protein
MFVDASACDEVETVVGIEVGIDVCETLGMFVVDASAFDEVETKMVLKLESMFVRKLECFLLMHLLMK